VPFSLAAAQRVQVFVVDLTGRRVRTLIDRALADGDHAAVWDGLADGGRRARPGVYYVVLGAGDAGRKGQKVVLLP
jgi:flagellar hook assembly protein FlgD